jgi:tetratricopeptide (TPR) repeat protein
MLRPSLADPEHATPDESSDDSTEPSLRRARQLRLEGSYEEAAALYRSVLEVGPREADAIALAAAESSLAAGDYVPAVAMANRALELNPERLEANVVKAEALRGLGLTSDARGLFEEAIDDPLIGGYAAFRAAELAEAAGDRAAMRQLFAQAIDLGLDSWWETIAARRIGKDHLALGDSSSAIPWLTRATTAALVTERRGSPVWFHGELVRRNAEARRAPILLELARAQLQAGARDAAVETYVTTAIGYPSTTEGRDALGALVDLGATGRLTPYQRGLILFNASRDREAIGVLSSAEGEEAATARYYLGLAQRDVGNRSDAVAELTEMARAYPADRLAPEALWQAARMLDGSGNRPDAIAAYFAVADAFPASDQAARALLRIGWLNVAIAASSVLERRSRARRSSTKLPGFPRSPLRGSGRGTSRRAGAAPSRSVACGASRFACRRPMMAPRVQTGSQPGAANPAARSLPVSSLASTVS